MAKHTNDLPELDFRKKIEAFLADKKAKAICEQIGVAPVQFSRFISQKGGIHWQALIRLIIVMGYQIVDENGNVVLGNKQQRVKELQDNTTKVEDV